MRGGAGETESQKIKKRTEKAAAAAADNAR